MSKLGRKFYLTKKWPNLLKLGNFFDKVFEKNGSKFVQILTTFYSIRFSSIIGCIHNFYTYKKYVRKNCVIIFSCHIWRKFLCYKNCEKLLRLWHIFTSNKFDQLYLQPILVPFWESMLNTGSFESLCQKLKAFKDHLKIDFL